MFDYFAKVDRCKYGRKKKAHELKLSINELKSCAGTMFQLKRYFTQFAQSVLDLFLEAFYFRVNDTIIHSIKQTIMKVQEIINDAGSRERRCQKTVCAVCGVCSKKNDFEPLINGSWNDDEQLYAAEAKEYFFYFSQYGKIDSNRLIIKS